MDEKFESGPHFSVGPVVIGYYRPTIVSTSEYAVSFQKAWLPLVGDYFGQFV